MLVGEAVHTYWMMVHVDTKTRFGKICELIMEQREKRDYGGIGPVRPLRDDCIRMRVARHGLLT